jgi:transposase-like protein
MGRRLAMGKHTEPEKIVRLLRDAEAELAGGKTVAQVVQKLGVSEQTYYRWRQRYGGMQVDEARRLKELEAENARLKRLVAELALDKQMLQEVVRGKF